MTHPQGTVSENGGIRYGAPRRSKEPMPNPIEKFRSSSALTRALLALVPVPFVLGCFLLLRWNDERRDFDQMKAHFLSRQNAVLAFGAASVATGFSDLLEKSARDVQVLRVLPKTTAALRAFYTAQLGDFTRFDADKASVSQEELPFYNRLALYDGRGRLQAGIELGKVGAGPKSIADCRLAELCDGELLAKVLASPPGTLRYGRVVRFYTPKGDTSRDDRAGLTVALRDTEGVIALTVDFRHLHDHLSTPTFPYEPKRDLMQAYNRGNYIYIVDQHLNVITHPMPWHQAGIDRATGTWKTPLKTDDEVGKAPINIGAYAGERVREYFRRLVDVSFKTQGVDVFKAPNMAGIQRVISVSPIQLSSGQFAANAPDSASPFGWTMVGCAVEYFEEPRERLVPYY